VQTPTNDQNVGALTATDSKDRRIRYDEAFKLEAIRLWKASHRSARETAGELGISILAEFPDSASGRQKTAATRHQH